MKGTLFQRLLGAEFFHLASPVKALHARQGAFECHGRVSVERGTGLLSRLCGAFARLAPPMQEAPITVRFDADAEREVWRRSFNGWPMVSVLRLRDGRLQERMGLLTFRFRLYRVDTTLHWVGERARVLGLLPLPTRWIEEIRCAEYAEAGRYHFRVEVNLPVVGPLVTYSGWLDVA